MTTAKYSSLDLGTIEAVFNKLGGIEGAQRFLRGDVQVCEPTRRWRVAEDGSIHFSVTSNGMTPKQWIAHLEKRGIIVTDYAKSLLMSPDFKVTSGVTTEIVVLPGKLFNDSDRVTAKIRTEADKRKLVKPNAEVGCLIRDMFTDKEIEAMGLTWIITMLESMIKDSGGFPGLLSTDRDGSKSYLGADCDSPDGAWYRGHGFAFALSHK